ncbi:type II secretion system F family protein [Candidatus Woesearchaeota archaeon]|nr:type II secretion system F family protein [Candidatus Woesearchaeota archaeon]
MELKPKHWIGLILGSIIILIDVILFFNFTSNFGPKVWYFNPILVVGFLIAGLAFLFDFLEENKRQKELEIKFLEFVRSLVENVRSGVTIPQAIIHVSNVNFGSLTPYVVKLAHQLEWGYPLHTAFNIFAEDTDNKVIKRSINIVIEAERSGGDMSSVLEAVTKSVFEIKKIKDERKSNAYTQTIQSYFIYFFFVAIMIVLQIYLIPKLSLVGGDVGQGLGTLGITGLGGSAGNVDFNPIFITTIIVQGIFAGLMTGKFSEGDYKSGVKHSIIMTLGGYLVISTATGIVDPAESLILLMIPTRFILKRFKCLIIKEE